jgi:hypothetical protein
MRERKKPMPICPIFQDSKGAILFVNKEEGNPNAALESLMTLLKF